MGIVAKYKFNQNVYENFIPTFNSGFTDYTVTDEIDTDGFTIRTIESDDLPMLIKFGKISTMDGNPTNQTLCLLKVIDINTENVTDMRYMFRLCKNVVYICTDKFNTSKTSNMCGVFQNCSSLTSLDVSNFNTSKTTLMHEMFQGCSSLISLDVSNFNTSQVTNMYRMFRDCSSLTSLDVSNFNTSQVTNMSDIFNSCSSLTSLDVSNFDTSEVTNMGGMFYGCSSLTSLDVSNFNTSQVTNMKYMFSSCSSLISLDLSNFNTSKITDMNSMFTGCSKLTSLNVSSFDTSQVANMSYMFNACSSLQELDLSSFNTDNLSNIDYIFDNTKLKTIDISNFNIDNVKINNRLSNNINYIQNIAMIYSSSKTINILTPLLALGENTKIYCSLPDISELEPHDNVEYIKYIFPTKVQLPPHIQLHRLPDGTCDELDIKTGILTRNVECVVLDGSYPITLQKNINDYVIFQFEAPNKIFGNNYNSNWKKGGFSNAFILNPTEERIGHYGDASTPYRMHLCILKSRLSSPNVDGLNKFLFNNPILFIYQQNPITEKLILNYNNSCNYGVILPRGTSDNYNVITNEYKQNLDFIPIDGSITFDTATIKDTTVKFSVALSKFEVDTTNVRGNDGIYCDNNLFKYEANDNDYEHAYIENDTTLHIYVNKSRLSSYDQVGFQIYLTNNPFNLCYAMRTPIISYVNYEDLDPEKASWEMLDCAEDGSITIESGKLDKTLLLDCMDYVAPTKNRFEIDLLKANTQYTIYAEGVSGRIQLNFGGNIVNFTSGNIYTSGETQLVEFYTDNEIKNLIIIEGDTRTETIEFFEGLKSSENVTVISSNAPFVFGKGGKIQ